MTKSPRWHRAQHGVVLFFALIALLVMSLAAVALIRSVDTSTLIAGNLAFKQSATNSGDKGIESAVTFLANTQVAMKAANNNVFSDLTNAFNVDAPAQGYYSWIDPALVLTDSGSWTNAKSISIGTDNAGNDIRYIIQRMCRTANSLPTTNNCLFSSAVLDNNQQSIPLPSDICSGSGCPVAGQSPQFRITSRILGPSSSVSYVQAFVN